MSAEPDDLLKQNVNLIRRDLRRWHCASFDEARDLRGVVADLRNTTEYILDKIDTPNRLFWPLVTISVSLSILTLFAGVLAWGMR